MLFLNQLYPGYDGGSVKAESWVIKVERPTFEKIIARLQQSQFTLWMSSPQTPRPGALQFLALDPMGFTVEIYTEFTSSSKKLLREANQGG